MLTLRFAELCRNIKMKEDVISEIDVVKIVFTLCGQSDAFVYSYTRVKGHKIFEQV